MRPPARVRCSLASPLRSVLTYWLKVSSNPHCYPPQPIKKAAGDDSWGITNATTVVQSDRSQAGDGNSPFSVIETGDPLLLPPTPTGHLSAYAVEINTDGKVADEKGPNDVGIKLPRSHHMASEVATAINGNGTKLALQKLMHTLPAAIVAVISIFLLLAFGPLNENAVVSRCIRWEQTEKFRYAAMNVFVWAGIISPVDCATPWEGARVIMDWTSPGVGELQQWLYETVLGLPVVSAQAILEKDMPHWSFHGQTGHIAIELHRNATLTTVIIESDFPDSIPHSIRIWTFISQLDRCPCCPQPPAPAFAPWVKSSNLFPLLLGDAPFRAGSTPREREYHIPPGCCGRIPVGMVIVEFLSNGGSDVTRIDLVRILGVPF